MSNLDITVNNKIIEPVDHFNYLGITLDQNITWTPHLDNVSIKIYRVNGLLRKLHHIFPKHILIIIYNSLIHSYLLVFSHGVLEVDVLKFFKKAIRVVANRAYNAHTTPIFKELGILKINDLYQVQLYKLHYRKINNLLPAYFRTFAQFLTLYGEYNYNLRNSHFRHPMTKRDLFVQSTKISIFKINARKQSI